MAETDNIKQAFGISSNPGILLRAHEYMTAESELAYSANYLDGKAVKGSHEGQKLMETPWFQNGVLNNIVLPTLYIEATSSAQSMIDNLIITIYKRDSAGTQYETKELTVYYQYQISDGVGQMPNAQYFMRQSTDFTWFDIRYEYKFVVSVGKITESSYLYLEGIYLQYVPNTGVMGFYQEHYGTNSVQAIPMIEGIHWIGTSDGSGNITGQLTEEVLVGDGTTEGGQRSLMNAIDAVVTTFAYQTTADTSTVITNGYTTGSYGGYIVTVDIRGLAATTAYEFYTIVLGYQTPTGV